MIYLQWYGKPHAAVELQLEAVYGLPEVSGHTVSILSFQFFRTIIISCLLFEAPS